MQQLTSCQTGSASAVRKRMRLNIVSINYIFFLSSIGEDNGANLDSDEEGDGAPKRFVKNISFFENKNRYVSTDFDSNFRPMTGKEARKSRSAKVKKNIEDGSLAYDEDFYK